MIPRRWRKIAEAGSTAPHETFSLRAERELEDRGRANALEHDAFHAYRARRDHRHCRGDVDGHRPSAEFKSGLTKAWPFWRRRSLRRAVAVEERGRLVELSRPQEDQDRIRGDAQPHDRDDAELESDPSPFRPRSVSQRSNTAGNEVSNVSSGHRLRITSLHRHSISKRAAFSTNWNRAAARMCA